MATLSEAMSTSAIVRRRPLADARSGASKGATEAAVFVHGNPGSVHDWARLVAATGEHGRRRSRSTSPGYGDADKPKTFPYTVEGYANSPETAPCRSSASSGRT